MINRDLTRYDAAALNQRMVSLQAVLLRFGGGYCD